jgi:hypothetical protein
MGAARAGSKRRRRATKPKHPWDHWSQVKEAEEADHYALIQRVRRDRPNDPAVNHLIDVESVVRKLWRALACGKNVDNRARALYRAATGRHDDTEARRMVIAAIQQVAWPTDQRVDALLWGVNSRRLPIATDTLITSFVCMQIPRMKDAVARLKENPAAVATAVRKCRSGRGRPKAGGPAGSKWSAIAEVLQLAGLGKLDEKAVEQLWKEHGPKEKKG